MKIIYNPKDGAPISQFIYNGIQLETHYPDGALMPDGKIARGLVQYEDEVAETLTETYLFLQDISVEQAKEILDRPDEPKWECDFPDCGYKTTAKVALIQHSKKHEKDRAIARTPLTDLIPVASGKRVLSLAEKKKMQDNTVGLGADIPNGTDKDGVDWYGEGVDIENNSAAAFNGVRKVGQGHFVG
jgi:hypothetical protein